MNIAKPISAVTEENLKTRFGSLAAPTFKELIDKALKVEKNINCAFPTKLSLCTYPTLVKYLLSLEQSLLSPKKK